MMIYLSFVLWIITAVPTDDGRIFDIMKGKCFGMIDSTSLRDSASDELEHVRRLGCDDDLILASANLGVFEALLLLLSAEEAGTPVYQVVTGVQTRFSSQSGVISRLRTLRERGLIDERPGRKRSQVCLFPSERLLKKLGPLLLDRNAR